MVEEANRGKLMVAEADRDKLGQRESGVRPWREGERSQVVAAEVKRGELIVFLSADFCLFLFMTN